MHFFRTGHHHVPVFFTDLIKAAAFSAQSLITSTVCTTVGVMSGKREV